MYQIKPYIRDELELLNVSTLDKVRRKEKIIEEKLKKEWNKNHDKYRRSIPNTKTDTKYQPPHLRNDNKTTLEAQRMKEGKCKYCGEKWDPRHRCLKKETTKNLYQCEAEEEDKSNSDESDIEETRDIENPSSDSKDEETPKISIAAITGIHQPQTLKFKGHKK